MGHAGEKTEKLAAKLKQIRKNLGLSQSEIIKLLALEDTLTREDVSKFERGIRQPSLRVILQYARAFHISTDILIDDAVNLPERTEC